MTTGLAAQRVLRDVEVVARAGLDLETFLSEALESLSRALPYVGACVGTVDPATHLLTGTYKFGDLRGRDELDHEWGLLEYGQADTTSFRDLARAEDPAVAVSAVRRDEPEATRRVQEFMTPYYGYSDELRVIARDRQQVWAGLALFRDPTGGDFDADDVALARALSPALSAGIRGGLLARTADETLRGTAGPAVIVIGPDGHVKQYSHGAAERVADLLGTITTPEADGMISSLVGASRRFAQGLVDLPPRARVRSRSGMWHVLHASPMCGPDGAVGDVVVTIDEARPPEIVPLVVSAFGLTPRERDVTQLVLRGMDTKEIGTSLHLSSWTVQDHLKAVFDKAGVRSRRELIARIYFDQYVPRMRTEASEAWG
ncbi:helix-turn-helix transcriptional regulator [Aquipuribacter nitratireducens]|uniref:LuxR C-terminal-related transcriptional regulator n=1 Tax=Aquipuribacter nitratireducens TaxID=650104 RepID=A0ABW0GHX4_9MICO